MKKKVSFDIDEEKINEVREYCFLRNIRLSDFFREATIAKLETDKNTMTIFIGLEKFVIDTKHYDINIFEAEQNLKELVPNAVHEGELRVKEGIEPEEVIGVNGTSLKQLISKIEPKKSILFFTRARYSAPKPHF